MAEAVDWLERGLKRSAHFKSKNLQFEAPVTLSTGSVQYLKIGAWSYIQSGCIMRGKVTIGRYCSIAENIVINPPKHPTHFLGTSTAQYQRRQFDYWMAEDLPLTKKEVKPYRPESVNIGNDVWIGRGVLIMNGVAIGDGAIVAAGSVVTKDVAAYQIVGGIPAKLIRMRFDGGLVRRLQDAQWWQYDRNDLAGVPFDNPHAALDEIGRRVTGGTLQSRPVAYQEYAQSVIRDQPPLSRLEAARRSSPSILKWLLRSP